MLHLISHCNARLQAMLPDRPPAQHQVPSSSSPLAAVKATSNSPEASASDAQTQHEKLPSLSPSQQLVRGIATEQSPVQQCHASAAEEEVEEQGSRADGQCAIQAPLLEAEAGQAVAEATLELMLAVLRGSEDTGELCHHLTGSVHSLLSKQDCQGDIGLKVVLMPAMCTLQKRRRTQQ